MNVHLVTSAATSIFILGWADRGLGDWNDSQYNPNSKFGSLTCASMNPRTKAELFLALATLIWGATFVVVKESLGNASPLTLIALRFGIAALLFLPFCYARLAIMERAAALRGVILGTLLFVAFAAQTFGLQYTSSSKSGFITGMLVVFTPIFQLVIEHRPPRLGNLIGVILVMGGLYLLTRPQGADFNLGDGLTLLCAVVFALHIVYLDIFSKEHDVFLLTFLQMAVTVLLALLLVAFFQEYRLEFTAQFWFALGYLSILATLAAFYLQTRYQKQTSPTRAAIIFSLEPVFSAMFAYIFRDEMIGFLGVLGGGLIVSGLMISELSDVIFSSPRSSRPERGLT